MREYGCRFLYCYIEGSDQPIFFSEFLFAVDIDSKTCLFQTTEGKTFTVYMPNLSSMYHEIELAG